MIRSVGAFSILTLRIALSAWLLLVVLSAFFGFAFDVAFRGESLDLVHDHIGHFRVTIELVKIRFGWNLDIRPIEHLLQLLLHAFDRWISHNILGILFGRCFITTVQ